MVQEAPLLSFELQTEPEKCSNLNSDSGYQVCDINKRIKATRCHCIKNLLLSKKLKASKWEYSSKFKSFNSIILVGGLQNPKGWEKLYHEFLSQLTWRSRFENAELFYLRAAIMLLNKGFRKTWRFLDSLPQVLQDFTNKANDSIG